MNLRIAGSISTNTVEKAVSWNVGPHGYQRGKKEIHKIFEQGPPIICLQDVRIPKRRKNSVKRELQRVFPHYWIYITTDAREVWGKLRMCATYIPGARATPKI